MDAERRSPTHVVARDRIRQQLDTWRAEHPGWEVQLQIPLTDNDVPKWSLLMSFRFPTDDETWYTRHVLHDALVNYFGDPHTSVFTVLYLVNNDLLDMQREIGVMHSGARTE